MYSNTFFPGFPCPSCLFLSIRRITRIRVQSHIGAGKGISSDLNAITSAIATEVDRFSPATWEESYLIPDEPCLSLLAISFKTATQLYGILSLPPTLAIHFCPTRADEISGDRLRDGRKNLRARLLRCLDQISRLDATRKYLCTWLVATLGVASHDASAREREHVLGYIENVRRQSGVDCGAATLLGIIPRFWESNKTAWDQCFYKPCQVLS